MTAKIVRLNASALYAAGFDRPTVEALLNLLRITGNDPAGVTVPELAGKADDTDGKINDIKQQIVIIQMSTDFLESAPTVADQDPRILDQFSTAPKPQQVEPVEFLQTQVRQMAEQLSQVTEYLQTEVRQIAEKQFAIGTMIDELKQGTML